MAGCVFLLVKSDVIGRSYRNAWERPISPQRPRSAARPNKSRRITSSKSMLKISLQVALISHYCLEFGLSGSVKVWKLVYKKKETKL